MISIINSDFEKMRKSMSGKQSSLDKMRKSFKSFEDVTLFVQIFLLISILPLLIKFLSIQKLLKLLTPKDVKSYQNQERAKEMVVKYTDYILGRNYWMYKKICLKRSLILYHFLKKLGMNIRICFGVKLPDGKIKSKLEGHAWLVYQGDIFLERDVEMTKSYKITYCFPEMSEQIA